jgi:hypothetical protein
MKTALDCGSMSLLRLHSFSIIPDFDYLIFMPERPKVTRLGSSHKCECTAQIS